MGQGAPGRHLTAAVALIGLLALTGCTAEPDPPPTTASPTTTSPTPTPTPTPTETTPAPPTKPAAMDLGDETGAIAAAEYFMAVYDYARRTGDLTEWDRFSGQTCEFCANTHDAVSGFYQDGDRLSGGTVTVEEPLVVAFDDQLGVFAVQLTYSTDASQRLSAAGAVLNEYAGEAGWLILEVAPSARGWVLMGGDHIDEPLQ